MNGKVIVKLKNGQECYKSFAVKMMEPKEALPINRWKLVPGKKVRPTASHDIRSGDVAVESVGKQRDKIESEQSVLGSVLGKRLYSILCEVTSDGKEMVQMK